MSGTMIFFFLTKSNMKTKLRISLWARKAIYLSHLSGNKNTASKDTEKRNIRDISAQGALALRFGLTLQNFADLEQINEDGQLEK